MRLGLCTQTTYQLVKLCNEFWLNSTRLTLLYSILIVIIHCHSPFSSLAASTCQWSESTVVQFSSAPGATGEKFTFSVLQLQQPVVVNLSGTLTRVTEMYTEKNISLYYYMPMASIRAYAVNGPVTARAL